MKLLKKDTELVHLTVLIEWFSTESQKKTEQFNSYSPTVYVSVLTRWDSALYFQEEKCRVLQWGLPWAQATWASWGTSSVCTDNTVPCSLLSGIPVAGQPVLLVSVIQSHITSTSTTDSLAGLPQIRYQERTESSFSPYSPAKPVQRHLGRTTCNCLAVTREVHIYGK